MRWIITGGGTAGHIIPGLAVADVLRRRDPEAEILWVGVPGRHEEVLVPREGIPLELVQIRSLQRSLSPAGVARNLTTALWILPRAILAAGRIVRRFQPQAVLATGGYVCAPVGIAAIRQEVPLVLVEPNSLPGLATKLLARWATRICVAFPEAVERLGSNRRVTRTGAPVRPGLLEATREEAMSELDLDPARRTLLVMGGSLGARRINQALAELLTSPAWLELSLDWQILHASGPAHLEHARRAAGTAPAYHLHPYLFRNDLALAAADLAVVRAGALTLAEITARGVPAVVVPWAGSAEDHHTVNARSLTERGAAVMIPDAELDGPRLSATLATLMSSEAERSAMAVAARSLGRRDAAERVAAILVELARR